LTRIALVGKPNVGKSSLFNLLAKERIAVTSEIAGTTRDFKKVKILLDNVEVEIVDTGGIEKRDEMFDKIKIQSVQIAKSSDIVLFMVDGNTLPDDVEKKMFYEIQSEVPHIALIINKIDSDKHTERTWNFYEFGCETMFPLSVAHNRGTLKLREWILSNVAQEIPQEQETIDDILDEFDEDGNPIKIDVVEQAVIDNTIKVSILGRPNVGKSSLLNALLGIDRAIVSPIAGTTVDPVDEEIEYRDKVITFVDTAGVRRRGKIEGIEKFALYRTEDMLKDSDIAILVLDASDDFKDLDEKIAGIISKFKLGVIVVFNKWDIVHTSYEKVIEEFKFKFKFLTFAPIITLSAHTKRHIDKLKDKILDVYENLNRRIPTSLLNDTIKEAMGRHKIPSVKGKPVRIYFATQFDVNPPRIALVMNKPEFLHFSYKRYLINHLRDNFNFEGVQLDVLPRRKNSNQGDNPHKTKELNSNYEDILYEDEGYDEEFDDNEDYGED
jgi:GTP-binding protein